MGKRTATATRETSETKIRVELALDGRGRFEIETSIKMFNHMLSHIAQHGIFDITIEASGWDQHHPSGLLYGISVNVACAPLQEKGWRNGKGGIPDQGGNVIEATGVELLHLALCPHCHGLLLLRWGS